MDHENLIWHIGKLVVTVFLMYSMGATIRWIYRYEDGVISELLKWNNEKKKKMLIVFFYLACSYIMTGVSIMFGFESKALQFFLDRYPGHIIGGILVATSVLITIIEYIPYESTHTTIKLGAWSLLNVLFGFVYVYFGPVICTTASLWTFYAILLGTSASFFAPRETYLDITGPVSNLYTIVGITTFFSYFSTPPQTNMAFLVTSTNIFGGIILYFGVYVTNVQYTIKDLDSIDFDPIFTATIIYLSTMNLLVRIGLFLVIECQSWTVPSNQPPITICQ